VFEPFINGEWAEGKQRRNKNHGRAGQRPAFFQRDLKWTEDLNITRF